MEPITLTRTEAGYLAVIAQRLDRRPRGKVTKARVLELIEHLGCVQLDTISVVARSHETVLWSRLGPFDPQLVWDLYTDRKLFEYWTHAAAITPLAIFPYFHEMMSFYRTGYRKGELGDWLVKNQETVDHVRQAIREFGPQQSRHFEAPDDRERGPWVWFGGKPAKMALDFLWTVGELTILNRIGFQRVYELTERAVPAELRERTPSDAERRRFFVSKALSAMGITTPRWCADYFRSGARYHVNAAGCLAELTALEQEGLAIPARIQGYEQPVWLDPAMVETLAGLRAGRGKPVVTTFLSPFDNLVWHRERAQALFGFDYLLEIYVPAPKRIWGYYTMPILHRGKLVGRLDLHYARKAKLMTIRTIHLEPTVRPTQALASAIIGAAADYLHFLGGGEMVLGEVVNPPELAPLLLQAIRSEGPRETMVLQDALA